MRKPNQKYVGGDIPKPLWDAVESWAAGRPKIDKRRLLTAVFRIFLAAPESVKLAALYGRATAETDEALAEGLREIVAEVVRAERRRKS